MHLVRRWAPCAGALALLLGAAGCGPGKVKVYPVKGQITLDGKPMVGGGVITFIPIGNQRGQGPGGEIAADGSYTLTTHKPGDGSMEGEFRVLILQTTEREPEPTRDGEKAAKPPPGVAEADRIPLIYSDPLTSPLKAKVEAKASNELNFQLKRSEGANIRPPGARGNAPARDPVAWLRR
jgi:hypothetical protein